MNNLSALLSTLAKQSKVADRNCKIKMYKEQNFLGFSRYLALPYIASQTVIYDSTKIASMMVKITIIGKVHDVGYGPFLLDLADSLLIERFDARNVIVEGKQAVVVLVEGDEEVINKFVEAVKTEKPENAIVEEVRVEEFKGFVRSIDSYRQSLMVSQLNKIVQVGIQMLKKQDLMLEKQDETIKEIKETREYLSEKIDGVREEVVKVRKDVVGEIRELRLDLKSYLDERLKKIESEIQMIKSKLGLI